MKSCELSFTQLWNSNPKLLEFKKQNCLYKMIPFWMLLWYPLIMKTMLNYQLAASSEPLTVTILWKGNWWQIKSVFIWNNPSALPQLTSVLGHRCCRVLWIRFLHGLENTLGLDKTLDLRLTFRSTRVKVGLDPGAIRVQILLAKNTKHIGSCCCCWWCGGGGGRKMNWGKIMVKLKRMYISTWQCAATEGSLIKE